MYLPIKHRFGIYSCGWLIINQSDSSVFAETNKVDYKNTGLHLTPFIQQLLNKSPKIPQTQAAWKSTQIGISQVLAYYPNPALPHSLMSQTLFSRQRQGL